MLKNFKRRLILTTAAVLLTPTIVSAQALEAWPDKPVKLIVPFAPGGFTDVVARILGQRLSTAMGQQFVIENKSQLAKQSVRTKFQADTNNVLLDRKDIKSTCKTKHCNDKARRVTKTFIA